MRIIVFQASLTGVVLEQVKALVAALPLRLKILDVAGSTASIHTFEPASANSVSATSPPQQHRSSESSSARRRPSPEVQKLWLIYRPGHYEIVYPERGSEDLEKL